MTGHAAASAAAFWRDPPWLGGRTPFRMGLKPIAEAQWLPDPIEPPEHARKRRLLAEQRDRVLAALPGSAPAQARVVEEVARVLAGRPAFAAAVRAGAEATLEQAALWVPDDLCVLSPSEQGYRLAAACLCSPSYWRLRDKIGRSMAGVHAPVEGLNEAIGGYIERFLEAMPPERIFQRRNWLIHQSDQPFQPEHERWSGPVTVRRCAGLFVRSETQTLRKFSDRTLLFTIRVRSRRLAEIADHPVAARDLLRAVRRMTAAERQSFGAIHHGEALEAYLSAIVSA